MSGRNAEGRAEESKTAVLTELRENLKTQGEAYKSRKDKLARSKRSTDAETLHDWYEAEQQEETQPGEHATVDGPEQIEQPGQIPSASVGQGPRQR